jgi:HD-GYP domain-containing protein (c-di-GMP phosphodiesterase class II)
MIPRPGAARARQTYNTMKKHVVPVEDLVPGMFVTDLDRPWLGTPFLLQGFLVDGTDQIAELRRLCRTVTVDPGRSTCRRIDFRKYAVEEAPARLHDFAEEPEIAIANDDFCSAAYLIRSGREPKNRGLPPTINAVDGQSGIVAEVLYSASIVTDVQSAMSGVYGSIEKATKPDVAELAKLTVELAQSVARNRDALLWLTRLKETDNYSYDHAIDVSVHMMVLASFLGYPQHGVESLGLAGLLQDIGKSEVRPELLQKATPLSDAERQEIRAHVASSLAMLRKTAVFSPSLFDIVANHHERFDGSGYPRGIAGEALSLHAEMSGLLDTYCAMLRARPYSEGLSNQHVLEEIVRMRGKCFRETLVDQMIQCIGLYPIGTLVDLNSGEVAVVIQQNQVRRLQPKVLVLLAPDKSVERHPRTLDLLMQPQTPTGEPYRILRALPGNAYGIDPRDFYLVG